MVVVVELIYNSTAGCVCVALSFSRMRRTSATKLLLLFLFVQSRVVDTQMLSF